MRIFFFGTLLFNVATGFAQDGYTVIYKFDDVVAPATFNGEKQMIKGAKTKLVVGDSLSFYYHFIDGYDPLKKTKIYGENIKHHMIIYNGNTGASYDGVAWPKGADNKYLITDTLKKENWTFGKDTKQVLGYECQSALLIDGKDSVLIWFTRSVPKPFGPLRYFGFPGLVLEVFDQRGILQHLVAIKIEEGPYKVVMPKEGQLISYDDFIKLKR